MICLCIRCRTNNRMLVMSLFSKFLIKSGNIDKTLKKYNFFIKIAIFKSCVIHVLSSINVFKR